MTEPHGAGRATPVTPLTQEIRLATTMTGGVSLAIWMGGVARELDLITQASNLRRLGADVTLADTDPGRGYLDLLNLLDVTVDIDVLSGTSAGGINASLLAYGRACQRDLGPLRDLWLQIGSLNTLLRDPTGDDLPSLLQGDAVMYANLHRALPQLPTVAHPTPNRLSTTLFVTTTLLTGEPSRFTDSYGTLVQDVNHRGLFRFTQDTLPQTAALALAARSSASFPAAFEPSFLPYTQAVPAMDGVPARPPVGRLANITGDHWVADGGLLDNQPLDALLQTVFDRPAKRVVRRVLLYVVPSTGPAPDPAKAAPADTVSKPYPMLDSLLKDVGAVLNQSIAADLRAIREHNERLGTRTDARLRLAQLATECEAGRPRDDRLLLTAGLFADFRDREADLLADKLVPEVLRLLATWPQTAAGPNVPPGWAAALQPGADTERACRQAVRQVLLDRWPARPDDLAGVAGFGRAAFQGGKAIALSMLRCAFLLARDDAARTSALTARLAALHGAFRPEDEGDVAAFVERAAGRPDVQQLPLTQAVAQLARQYLDALDQPAADLTGGWQQVTEVAAALVGDPALTTALDRPPAAAPGSLTAQRREAAEHLRTYADYLRPATTPDARALRIFSLGAAHRAMLPTDLIVDQPVELIQVSADTRTLLDLNRRTAASKLTGMQLHHFGAFYKRSWRANDWMWGRLDGAGWLVHLLLDPRRIATVAATGNGSRVEGFLGQLAGLGVPPLPAGDGLLVSPPDSDVNQWLNATTVRAELAYLDDGGVPVPASLPLTALWVARGLQRRVAAEELPAVAHSVLEPEPAGSPLTASAAARGWADGVLAASPADRDRAAGTLLAGCPVPEEKLATELGSPLMVRTVAKAAAVTTAAVNGMPQLPPAVRPVTSTARTVTLAGYRMANLAKALPRRMILAGLVLLLVGAALATVGSTLFGLTGLLIAAVGGYLIVFGAWQTSRAVLGAVISASLIGGALALTVPTVRHGLFGVQDGKQGWLNGRVIWLGETWWHPLAGVGLLIVVLAAAGMVFARRGAAQPAGAGPLSRRMSVVLAATLSLAVVALIAICLAVQAS
ncbi:MAG TPA: patatin-like protein [Jatrophihabitans sp.]|nr:patatin-like protein [Jatrophihabitans sp.]